MNTCDSCGGDLHFFKFSLCSKESILTLQKDKTSCMNLDISTSSDEDLPELGQSQEKVLKLPLKKRQL